MQYRVIEGDGTEEFERRVNKALQEGWRPLGGVSFTRWEWETAHDSDTTYWYVQAMIREEVEA